MKPSSRSASLTKPSLIAWFILSFAAVHAEPTPGDRFGENRIEMTRYDPTAPAKFTLPLINGKPVNLHPGAVYESPFLNGKFGADRFTISVGPIQRMMDFSTTGK